MDGNCSTYLFFPINAVDDIPPVITCIENVLETVEIGIPGKIVSWTEPTATDNSGVVNLDERTRAPGQYFTIGVTPVTYRFVDGFGNTAECTFRVIVDEGKALGYSKKKKRR